MSLYKSNWAFSWIQILSQNLVFFTFSLVVIWCALISGSVWGSNTLLAENDFLAGLASLFVMSLVAIKLLDSIKAAVIIFCLSLVFSFAVLGVFNFLSEFQWLTLSPNSLKTPFLLAGWVVVQVMMITNFIHFFSVMNREMARGLHQFDAVPEAIRQTFLPIFLSNLTTILGFWVVLLWTNELQSVACLVFIGGLLSIGILLTLFPLILLKLLLPFRVGSTSDRKGLDWLIKALNKWVFLRSLVLIAAAIMVVTSIFLLDSALDWPIFIGAFGVMFVVFFSVWRSFKWAVIQVLSSFFGLLIVLGVGVLMFDMNALPLWVLFMMAIGIVLDDGIHFFTRVVRAKSGYFSDDVSVIKYALTSVGRPIWQSSILLSVALLVFVVLGTHQLQTVGVVLLATVWVMNYVLLVFLPAFIISGKDQSY